MLNTYKFRITNLTMLFLATFIFSLDTKAELEKKKVELTETFNVPGNIFTNCGDISISSNLMISCNRPTELTFYNLADGKVIQTINEIPEGVFTTSISPDGKFFIIITRGKRILRYRLKSGQYFLEKEDLPRYIYAPCNGPAAPKFIPHSPLYIMTVCYEPSAIYNFDTSDNLASKNSGIGSHLLKSISHVGPYVVATSDFTYKFLDTWFIFDFMKRKTIYSYQRNWQGDTDQIGKSIASGEGVRTFQGLITGNTALLLNNDNLLIVDFINKKIVSHYDLKKFMKNFGVPTVTISPDGKNIAILTISSDTKLQDLTVIDLASGGILGEISSSNGLVPYNATFNSTGNFLLVETTEENSPGSTQQRVYKLSK